MKHRVSFRWYVLTLGGGLTYRFLEISATWHSHAYVTVWHAPALEVLRCTAVQGKRTSESLVCVLCSNPCHILVLEPYPPPTTTIPAVPMGFGCSEGDQRVMGFFSCAYNFLVLKKNNNPGHIATCDSTTSDPGLSQNSFSGHCNQRWFIYLFYYHYYYYYYCLVLWNRVFLCS
jgi:hypothetical protein